MNIAGGYMANTSLTLGKYWEEFIQQEIASGKYNSASEVVRTALRLLEKSETNARLKQLRLNLLESEYSSDNPNIDKDTIRKELKKTLKLGED